VSEPPQDSQVVRLRRLDSCAVSDALDALGLAGVLDGIAPVWAGARMAGRAITVQLAAGFPLAGQGKVHLGARAISRALGGEVVVVANDGRTEMGSWGGLLSVAAQAAGVSGVVTDGACRDVDEARELQFPVFARGAAARTARGRVHEFSTGGPIAIGPVTIRSGDLILADGTAVVKIAADRAEDVIARAEDISAREREMANHIRRGAPLGSVLGAAYEDMLMPQTGEQV
jgi:4-hydroxy-4-methyl-2-oxoglutarate aldolase